MESETILTAIKNIETALLDSHIDAGPAIDKIITDQLEKIRSASADTIVLELLFNIKYNWEIYCGKKESKGLRAGTDLLKHWILDDCEELRTYIQRYL